MDKNSNPEKDKLLYVSFNKDSSCISCGTEKGFQIFGTNPFRKIVSRELGGGIEIIEMLDSTNILALVGGGKKPKYSKFKVIIWDDKKGQETSEIRFGSCVRAIKIKKEKLFVVCEESIFVLDYIENKSIATIPTVRNYRGLFTISNDDNFDVLAFPLEDIGTVGVKFLNRTKNDMTFIDAHNSELCIIALNFSGTLLATSSERGTLIRIFNTTTRQKVQEVRRGTEKAEIFCISFDLPSKYLICSSDRGTIHIFTITEPSEDNDNAINEQNIEEIQNDQGILKKMKNFFKSGFGYFESEWSFAKLRLEEPKCICSFIDNNSIFIVTVNETVIKAHFDPNKKGDCIVDEESNLKISL